MNHPLPNPYLNYATRRITLTSTNRTKVLDFDIDSGETWQAWIFSNDSNNKSTLIDFELRGSFGTQGTIQTTIGGGEFGGDLLTGTGPCEVYATGSINNDISVWFTPEQTTRSLPPKSIQVQTGVIGSVVNVGYPPFGREYVDVKSTSNVKVHFRDDSGTIILTTTLYLFAGAPIDYNLATQALTHFHPPNTTLEVEGTVASQNIIITHSTS